MREASLNTDDASRLQPLSSPGGRRQQFSLGVTRRPRATQSLQSAANGRLDYVPWMVFRLVFLIQWFVEVGEQTDAQLSSTDPHLFQVFEYLLGHVCGQIHGAEGAV